MFPGLWTMMLVILKVEGQATRDSLRKEQLEMDVLRSIQINERKQHECSGCVCVCVCVFSQDADLNHGLCFSQEGVQGMTTRT